MSSHTSPQPGMDVLGTGLCFENMSAAAAQGFEDCEMDPSILPPMLRRRTSTATKMAITALVRACKAASVGAELPVIFTSSAGEMAVTDILCAAIAESRFPLSPSKFHNSVHNTAAGYWSLTANSMAPMQSMAGMEDSFAMGLLEAYCQLQSGAECLLLVSYDESLPASLLPECQWQACSTAWVLGTSDVAGPHLSKPYLARQDRNLNQKSSQAFTAVNPTQQSINLLKEIQNKPCESQTLQLSSGKMPWLIDLQQAG